MKRYLTLCSPTLLEWNGESYPCQIGKAGVRLDKQEGDGATPAGTFPLRQILYRPDRVRGDFTASLPLAAITPSTGWCDDPADPLYNQLVTLPYPGRHEELWREDPIYDIIIVVGYNDDPVIPHKGSAIFIHLLSAMEMPTAGCIALYRKDLINIIKQIDSATYLTVPSYLDQSLSIPFKDEA
jgi:L,D-peptidoglycan transpeptidase YkuD (ErfK/YbiS/YcfS/YnhG family)